MSTNRVELSFRESFLLHRWKKLWVVPFLLTTACVVVLQVGPRPLAESFLGSRLVAPATELPSTCREALNKGKGIHKPDAEAVGWPQPTGPSETLPLTAAQLSHRKQSTKLPTVRPPAKEAAPALPLATELRYRPLGEAWLLEAHETATQEIRERISQEHVYFALKFSIIGAILIVLFRLTKRGDIDDFLQMRRAALFFSAALLACGIVDTRLRFNALIMETLGNWLRNQLDPCVELLVTPGTLPRGGFGSWEAVFSLSKRSSVIMSLRYFSLSLTALLYAVFLYLFINVPARAHGQTLKLVIWTSVSLHALLLLIGASYCSSADLFDIQGPLSYGNSTSAVLDAIEKQLQLPPGLGTPAARVCFLWSLGLALVSITMVLLLAGLEVCRNRLILRRALLFMCAELTKKRDGLQSMVAKLKALRARDKLGERDRHMVEADLKKYWGELQIADEKLQGLDKHREVLISKPKENPENDEEVHDAEEYLWTLFFDERNRRRSLPDKEGKGLRKAWSSFLLGDEPPA